MNRNADILKELEDLNSPLSAVPADMPFAIPDNYLDGMAATLAEGVHLSEESNDPATPALPKTLPFAIPEGYFGNLSNVLRDHLANSSLESGIVTPYQIPPGYLPSLPAVLTTTAVSGDKLHGSKGKAISFRPGWKRIAALAAAATLVLGLSVGSYRYFNSTTPDAAVAAQLSKLDVKEVADYIEQNVDEFDTETLAATLPAEATAEEALPLLKPSEIQEYLEETGDTPPGTTNRKTL